MINTVGHGRFDAYGNDGPLEISASLDALRDVATRKDAMSGGPSLLDGWQPIETAPHNYEVKIKTKYFDAIAFFDTQDQKWFFDDSFVDGYVEVPLPVTHWKPQPPKENE